MSNKKIDKLMDIIKLGTISVPKYIFFNYKKLGITEEELILIIYFLNIGENIIFNPKTISTELNMDSKKVLELINKLSEKQLLSINIEKNKVGIVEEYISLELFYNKLSTLIMDLMNNNEEPIDNNLFQTFENEFGRTLSPMEYEIINGWIKEQFNNEIIIEALKEATFNGVSSLRYIDKILYEWKKKGIKTITDIRKQQSKYKEKKENIEVFDYDWLDGDD